MGYTTKFRGEIKIEPALSAKQVADIQNHSRTRHSDMGINAMPSIWCDWTAAPDGSAIKWNGGEKFYAADKWMDIVLKKFLRPEQKANGVILAQGEDMMDRWELVVVNNVVTRRPLR